MRKTLLVGFWGVCAGLLLTSSAVLAADHWLGTWKLDVAKSTFSPGPAPKSLTVTFAATPEGIKFTSDGVDAEDKPIQGQFVSKFDGKEVPYEGNPNADMASPKKINDRSYSNPWKKEGKVTITAHVLVSKDGKTLTVHQTGKNAKGEAVKTTEVFEKQ